VGWKSTHPVRISSMKIASDKVNTVVEDLCVEDTNMLDSCDQFSGDYEQLDLFD